MNRVYNKARVLTLGAPTTSYTHATQLLTNVPSDADNLIRRGVTSRWP